MRPNTRAFFFEGGLIARLAQAYAPPELLDSELFGPSSQVMLHNAG